MIGSEVVRVDEPERFACGVSYLRDLAVREFVVVEAPGTNEIPLVVRAMAAQDSPTVIVDVCEPVVVELAMPLDAVAKRFGQMRGRVRDRHARTLSAVTS